VQKRISEAIGIENAHFNRLLAGKRGPSIDRFVETAKAIEAETGGLVRAWELLGLDEAPAPPVAFPKAS
jgi:transcriptional regulator with XRE-family HTH domain